MSDFHVALLTQAMDSTDGLLLQGRIEARLHDEDTVGLRKVDSYCASSEQREESRWVRKCVQQSSM
jgi:hypothetical protein